MKPVIIHSDAKAEWAEAIAWYEERKAGLGLDLQSEVEIGIRRLQRAPQACPPYKKSGFRRQRVRGFPFAIFFMELPEIMWVAAVALTNADQIIGKGGNHSCSANWSVPTALRYCFPY